MSIWFKAVTPSELNRMGQNTMLAHLDIVITEIGENFLTASMPVDHRTVQPHGLLHGGASATLAESLGSIAGNLTVDSKKYYCVGLEINANHLRPVKAGRVSGTAAPVHLGRTTQVWEIKIYNEKNKLTCISRLTLAVLSK